jgi:BCCT, betaine/carnitine/choline family transporter
MISRVSKGRKVWEVIFYSLILPTFACLVWFCVWGGIGLRQSRQGMELEVLGETHFNNSGYFLAPGSKVCYDVPQENVVVNDEVVFTNYLLGVTPVCQFDPDKSSTASFNVLYSFSFPETFTGGGYGPVLSVFYISFLTLFFVTSMDSSSLIVDHIASNGSHSHHWIRRMFWAVTHGALATALLSSGGPSALRAVQAASVICGLPCVILLLFIMQCILLFCHAAERLKNNECYEFPDQPEFSMPVYGGIFNVVEFASTFGNVHKSRIELGIDVPTNAQVIEFVRGCLLPFVSLFQVLSVAYPTRSCVNAATAFMYGLCYIGWITMFSLSRSYPGLRPWACTSFFVCGAIMGKFRSIFRSKYNIHGNNIADFFTGLLLWPQVLAQMRLHCLALLREKANPDDAVPNTLNCDVEDSQSLSSS